MYLQPDPAVVRAERLAAGVGWLDVVGGTLIALGACGCAGFARNEFHGWSELVLFALPWIAGPACLARAGLWLRGDIYAPPLTRTRGFRWALIGTLMLAVPALCDATAALLHLAEGARPQYGLGVALAWTVPLVPGAAHALLWIVHGRHLR